MTCLQYALQPYLQAFHNTLDNLVLQATVFALCVFSDRDYVDVVILGLVARETEARPNVGIQLQLLPQSEIE